MKYFVLKFAISSKGYSVLHAMKTTLKCLSIGTPKITTFPFVPNGKWWIVGVPIFEHIMIKLQFAQILGHLKIINFPFGTNGKFIIFRCPNT